MKSEDVHIFTASTPLNALFSSTIASSLSGKKFLYLIDQEKHLATENFYNFSKLKGKIFNSVELISVRNKSWKSLFCKKKTIEKLMQKSEVKNCKSLWLCNDRRIENQLLISYVKNNEG